MLVALMLHSAGTSTPRCWKLIEPSRQFVMTTSRRSQVTSSYGCTPAVVKTRLTFRPFPRAGTLPPRRARVDRRSSVSVMGFELSLLVGLRRGEGRAGGGPAGGGGGAGRFLGAGGAPGGGGWAR